MSGAGDGLLTDTSPEALAVEVGVVVDDIAVPVDVD